MRRIDSIVSVGTPDFFLLPFGFLSPLFYKLPDRPIFLAQLSDAVLEVANAVDRTKDQPSAFLCS